MNGCIYRTKDGECDLYADGGKYHAFCDMNGCEGRKMSNADHIRSMSDEELASYLTGVWYSFEEMPGMCDVCDYQSVQNCSKCWLDLLKQEATE